MTLTRWMRWRVRTVSLATRIRDKDLREAVEEARAMAEGDWDDDDDEPDESDLN